MLDLEMTSGSKKLVFGKCLGCDDWWDLLHKFMIGYEFLVLWICLSFFYDYDDVNCKEVFFLKGKL